MTTARVQWRKQRRLLTPGKVRVPESIAYAVHRSSDGPPTVFCDRWLPLAWSRRHGYRPVPFHMMLAWRSSQMSDASMAPDSATPDADIAGTAVPELPPMELSEFDA
jgi:hypothetical protein